MTVQRTKLAGPAIVVAVSLVAACGDAPTRGDPAAPARPAAAPAYPAMAAPAQGGLGGVQFRVTQVVPDIRGNAFLGYVMYDQLPPRFQANAAKLGYKAGDQIPTKRYDGGVMYFLKPPQRNLRTTNPADWVLQ